MSSVKDIKIAVIPKFNIFDAKRDANGTILEIGGYESKVLPLLSRALNCKLQVVIPEDEQWGSELGNGNWTGAMGMLQRNEADLALSRITITYERAQVGWPSFPYDFQNIVFVTRLPSVTSTKMSFLYPFDPKLWFIVLAVYILMPVLCRFLLKYRYPWQDNVFNVVQLVLHQSPDYSKVSDYGGRLLIFSFIAGSTILSMGYNSVILSVLTVPPKQPGLETISQLAKAVENGAIKAFATKGSFIVQYLLSSNIDSVRYIGETAKANAWEVAANDAMTRKVLFDDGDAFVTPDYYVKSRWGPQLLFSKESFGFMYVAIFANKNFCCKSELDMFVQRLFAAGIYNKIMGDFSFRLQLKQQSSVNRNDNDIMTLTFWKLSEAFIVLGIGLSVSFIVWICELLFEKFGFRTM
ncbi:glutamate [NMDA] receptor subunit 1-like [Parasteatoda tepidariorum]|uniref:glutamate [NMDA] receptor subunit 1-like n=1 Tax=Parasteatoda tepidariorum TaxID=114398 RepID=UPI001C728E42|nr:glutamate [NMDA] receptor subunit 1-like [Parasteatoda tepidariorum]